MAVTLPYAVALLNSGYGTRVFQGSTSFHTGVDFAVVGNRAVPAADSGTVTRIEYTALKGYQLEITHSSYVKTRYHMLRSDLQNTVREGQYVQKGATVGHVAPVKYAANAAWTGPHLHFEVWLKRNSSSGPTGSWFHHNPQASVSNAGGPSGYTPSYPSTSPATGGGTNPIEDDDMPTTDEIAAAVWNRLVDEMTPAWQVLKNVHRNTQDIPAGVVNRLVSGDKPLWRVLRELDLRTEQLVTKSDTIPSDIPKAVVDRPVSGNKRLWEVLRDLDQRPSATVNANELAKALSADPSFISVVAEAVAVETAGTFSQKLSK